MQVRSKARKNRNYLFEMLENYNNREHVDTSNENITIEHIFPRNPHDDWNTNLSSEDYFSFKEKYLNTIGNLTLSGNNGALSNKSFIDKKQMNIDGNEQGYNYSRLWLNTYLKSLESWTVTNYEERQNLIYERFLKIWEYPDVAISENEDSDEQNIFDAESPRNKKLEYFIFENTKIEEDTIARMYFYIIKNLYERNSQLLIENQNILKITRNATDFRADQLITNGWYIESNIDSNSKFSILKKLLALYELEDELLIKYSSGTDNDSEPSRFMVRKKYWHQLLPLLENTSLFSNVNPTKDHWLSTGAGIAGISYTFGVSKTYVRIELSILHSSKETNKKYFKNLYKNKEIIEQKFGGALEWEELPDNKMSRIKIEEKNVSISNDSDWEIMNNFLVCNLPKFEKAFEPFIKNLK
ncbi:MAG: DUF4268 domain-containing protein [Flavobacterium sp.]|uniref:DUF4268 domain-containing protein n=1 Tax=Flavobacterium sp. TaxID=239 RepID=UPI00326786CD